MQAIKRILVPIDFGSSSSGAIQLAVGFAQVFGAELTLLHVWELPVYPYTELLLNTNELLEAIEAAATERLGNTLKSVQAASPKATSLLKMGVPWEQILEAIRELSPDLVVMGTHGRKGVTHALLGSVAEKIVRLSPVPVLTARASDAPEAS